MENMWVCSVCGVCRIYVGHSQQSKLTVLIVVGIRNDADFLRIADT